MRPATVDYEEVRFESKSSGISGAIDLIVDLGREKLIVVEIKTMDKDEFKTLAAPLSEHRLRTALYLELIRDSESGYRHQLDTEFAIVLYISKAYGLKHAEHGKVLPLKEFELRPTAKERDEALSYFDLLKPLKRFREEGGKLPPHRCDSATCKRAKECIVSKECFSGTYGPTFTYSPDEKAGPGDPEA